MIIPTRHFHPLTHRSLIGLFGLLLGGIIATTGCSEPQTDPMQQTIPTESAHWQQALGETLERLDKADSALLSRYMIRMTLSDAYESGAMPSTTVEQALTQQREYERLHPNNPTGEKSPVAADQSRKSVSAQTYPVTLLPVTTSDDDSLSQVELQFMLSNHGSVPIQSFQGTLKMTEATLSQDKKFNIPLTQFDPAIEPEQSGKLIINSSIEDVAVMHAIKQAQAVTIDIHDGTLVLSDGERIEIQNVLE